jgi:hypothetical protein
LRDANEYSPELGGNVLYEADIAVGARRVRGQHDDRTAYWMFLRIDHLAFEPQCSSWIVVDQDGRGWFICSALTAWRSHIDCV